MVNIRKMLEDQEGIRLDVYLDNKRNPTVAIGHLITHSADERRIVLKNLMMGDKITPKQCEALYQYDIATTINGLNMRIVGYPTFKDTYKAVLISMGFNMGIPRLTKFVNMLSAMRRDDDDAVIRELKDSDYYHELPNRVNRLIDVINGKIPPEYQ